MYKFLKGLVNFFNQIEFPLAGGIADSFHQFALIGHDFLQRIGNHLVAAKDNLCLFKKLEQLIDKPQPRRISNGVQRIKAGKQSLPGQALYL